MSRPSVLDLFSGAGGLSLGVANVLTDSAVIAVDQDADSCATVRLNRPEAIVIESDVADVSFEALGDVDVILAGPPCQGFSSLNRHRHGDPRNGLYMHIIRAVRELEPAFLVVENVEAFSRSSECAHLLAWLREHGYVVRAGQVNCADFGVPQRRIRALVTAARAGLRAPWPRRTHGGGGQPRQRTVGDALAAMPPPTGANWHTAPEHSAEVVARMATIPPGGNRLSLPNDLRLACWRDTRGYTDVMGRLSWHRPSVTIRTQFFRAEKGRFIHPIEDRTITPREAARLQSFPDKYRFPATQSLPSVARQIGNAFPPVAAAAIAREVALG